MHKWQADLLKTLLRMALTVFGMLSLVSFAVPAYSQFRWHYLASTAALCLLLAISRRWRSPAMVMAEIYGINGVVLLLLLCVGYSARDNTRFITYASLLCALPAVIIDRPPRKLLFFACVICVRIGMAWRFDGLQSALGVLALDVCMSGAGIFIGYGAQQARLTDFEAMRQSDIQKRHDFLTGLYNRLEMFERFRRCEADEARPIRAMYMMDIDKFKEVNDLYGHIVGDACLEKIGGFCAAFGEKHGMDFFRYGGEEILAVAYDEADPAAIAAELLEGIRALRIPHKGVEGDVVTVSIGYTTERCSCEGMVDRADRALYQAKRSGMNRAVEFKGA